MGLKSSTGFVLLDALFSLVLLQLSMALLCFSLQHMSSATSRITGTQEALNQTRLHIQVPSLAAITSQRSPYNEALTLESVVIMNKKISWFIPTE